MAKKESEATRYLYSVGETKRDVERAARRLLLLKKEKEITISALDQPVSNSEDTKKAQLQLLGEINEAENKLIKDNQELTKLEENAQDLIGYVQDNVCRSILELRYVEQMTWPKVMAELEKLGMYYSERQIFNYHRRAVSNLNAIWPLWRELKNAK